MTTREEQLLTCIKTIHQRAANVETALRKESPKAVAQRAEALVNSANLLLSVARARIAEARGTADRG